MVSAPELSRGGGVKMEVPLPEEQVEAGTARLKDGARAHHGCSGHVHLLLGEGAGAGGRGRKHNILHFLEWEMGPKMP